MDEYKKRIIYLVNAIASEKAIYRIYQIVLKHYTNV